LTASSLNKTVWLWDTASGKLLRRLEGHQDVVTSAVFSPDPLPHPRQGRAAPSTSVPQGVVDLSWQIAGAEGKRLFGGKERTRGLRRAGDRNGRFRLTWFRSFEVSVVGLVLV
jgi:WD40 repeat protein